MKVRPAALDDEKARAATRAVRAGELEHVPRRVAVVALASGYGAAGLAVAGAVVIPSRIRPTVAEADEARNLVGGRPAAVVIESRFAA